jgi:hypothetical protein
MIIGWTIIGNPINKTSQNGLALMSAKHSNEQFGDMTGDRIWLNNGSMVLGGKWSGEEDN